LCHASAISATSPAAYRAAIGKIGRCREIPKIKSIRYGRIADHCRCDTRTQPFWIGGKTLRTRWISPHWHVRTHPMAHSNLRIYRGPAERKAPVCNANTNGPATVTVDVGEVLPLLADAVASQRTWLSDFEDDQITISADLYEVLLAYKYYRHPAA
jgi:hypothetical protein